MTTGKRRAASKNQERRRDVGALRAGVGLDCRQEQLPPTVVNKANPHTNAITIPAHQA